MGVGISFGEVLLFSIVYFDCLLGFLGVIDD